jgi:hypothetical protein
VRRRGTPLSRLRPSHSPPRPTPPPALVDAYLSGHSRSADLVEAQAAGLAAGGAPDGSGGGEASPSSFFLLHGLRSLMGARCPEGGGRSLQSGSVLGGGSGRLGTEVGRHATPIPRPPSILRTRAGGNVDAALHRLGRCRELLLAELAEAEAAEEGAPGGGGVAGPGPGGGAALAAARLGAACGSLADARRRAGDLPGAEAALAEAARRLRVHAGGDAEAAHALSVTLGKLGDLQFFKAQAAAAEAEAEARAAHGGGGAAAAAAAAEAAGRAAAAAALPHYEEALQQRRALCGPLTGGRAGLGDTLDLAGALARVADAREVCFLGVVVVGVGAGAWAYGSG